MGLCKCPKKRVTNQFCFEHRVNVCEHCLVTSHPKCIVQSYLKWLQDHDYDPVCQLCKQNLASSECVRLLCYHVFHYSCVDKFARQLPDNTAPAGYVCPTCSTGIFPTTNVISPVADVLRQSLSRLTWAQTGLGHLPLQDLSQELHSHSTGSLNDSSNGHEQVNGIAEESPLLPSNSKHSMVSMDGYTAPTRVDHVEKVSNTPAFNSAFTAPRKLFDTTNRNEGFRNSYIDHDENKYKRRSPFEFVSRWFSSRAQTVGRHSHDPKLIYKRRFILAVLILLGFFTLVLVFVRLGRAHANSDPLLDPHLNPNLHIDDSLHQDVVGAKVGDMADQIL